jgi:hypothetical protein
VGDGGSVGSSVGFVVVVGRDADVSAIAVRMSSSEGVDGEFVHPKSEIAIKRKIKVSINLLLFICIPILGN